MMEMNSAIARLYPPLADVLLVVRRVLVYALGLDAAMLIAGFYYRAVRPVMACGYYHAMIVTDHARVIARGDQGIFTGYTDEFCEISQKNVITAEMMHEWGIIGVVCGANFAMMYSSTARHMWGVNSGGGLGIGHPRWCTKIKCVKTPRPIVSASCGQNFMITLCRGSGGSGGSDGFIVVGWGRGIRRNFDDSPGVPYTLGIQDPCAVAATGRNAFVLARGRVYMIGAGIIGIRELEYVRACGLYACAESCVIQITGGPSYVMFGNEVSRYNLGGSSAISRHGLGRLLNSFIPQVAIRAFEAYKDTIAGIVIGVDAGHNFTILTTSRGIYELSRHDGEYALVCLYTF